MKQVVRYGVSLMELLVVIAIIGVLAGILFSVLRSARLHTNKATCIANQRQIGMVIIREANDHDDILPQPNFWYSKDLSEKLLVCPQAAEVEIGYVYNKAVIGKRLGEFGDEDVLIADGDTPDHLATKPEDYAKRHFSKPIGFFADGHVEIFKP